MIAEGTAAPDFTLPAAVDGDIQTLTFSEYADSRITVLAFYPADFSPSCTDELCSLRDIDLFNLQRDVTILGVSTDSAFSHREFARQNGLEFPLCSDNDGRVARRYGVLGDEIRGHSRLAQRSVFVVDDRGTVRYAWTAEETAQLPDLAAVREAVDSIQDDRSAIERYQEAHDHFKYGQSEHESALTALADEEWHVAAEAFGEAEYYFEEAETGFDTARRFAESDNISRAGDRAKQKASHYRQSARWYIGAARRYGEGEMAAARDAADDAEAALDRARGMEPIPDLYSV
ncbi:Peroxiredoxin [Natronoarchaeum philippinense]|uniref:Peroxiredoxin n=1 Tax=Natronoarchaeum philippinense TaxID=558529 RepID=A0A285PDT8_NATPI|nr:redoxin domain-containing protein [Natronoarchaeum philippinense]SNZ18031.1 Peroxiredoxin [Natronoarchaeum philippinense]